MTGWGLGEEGALEAGVAAMSSILGMQGLPRDQAPVSNLMTGIMKAMGSIACLSEASTTGWAELDFLLCRTQIALSLLLFQTPIRRYQWEKQAK